jgi:hypothetical protein
LAIDKEKHGQIARPDVDRLEVKFRAESVGVKASPPGRLTRKCGTTTFAKRLVATDTPGFEMEMLASEMGNNRRTLLSHYGGAVSAEDEAAFWELRPFEYYAVSMVMARNLPIIVAPGTSTTGLSVPLSVHRSRSGFASGLPPVQATSAEVP